MVVALFEPHIKICKVCIETKSCEETRYPSVSRNFCIVKKTKLRNIFNILVSFVNFQLSAIKIFISVSVMLYLWDKFINIDYRNILIMPNDINAEFFI